MEQRQLNKFVTHFIKSSNLLHAIFDPPCKEAQLKRTGSFLKTFLTLSPTIGLSHLKAQNKV